jgi:RNA polymerase sigma-70 factor (ECF subfamily)
VTESTSHRADHPGLARPALEELDELTLLRARRGDEAATRALFDRYKEPVFRFLWRMLGRQATSAVVEDLTQDTFLRGFAALDRFSPDGPARLSTWLLAIAARLALNELRRQRRRGGTAMVELDDSLRGSGRTDEAAERRAIGARIAQELERLSPEHRAVFVLRDYHDLSYHEIAHALDIELGTVQSRLSRARAALRLALEDCR